ncbi:ester cyclase [uncultured Roseobacter sp.]|uniref:ester cyclase n=1 Tax=uncultured Roseobacter sp. TaxID=114847 RepID=UPI0026068C0B|nr:ester cyclase [uncultured Roseobacter sp.]
MANSVNATEALALKSLIEPYRAALFDFDARQALSAIEHLAAPDVQLRMCSPFGEFSDPRCFFEATYGALSKAMPDLECRDYIRISGSSQSDQTWVGIMGNILGTFSAPFLNIPPTGHLAYMRYHEFYRFNERRIVEVQAIWDLPELMMQAQAWPLAPSLGREWCVPAPSSLDGIQYSNADPAQSAAALSIVEEMLEQMKSYPANGGPETMQLERFWHPKMNWYGPSGIGSSRGFDGFTDRHMRPWVDGMPNWSEQDFQNLCHFFADGSYVGETGWPAMRQTLVAGGFLGIPPTGQTLDIRGLDFWRLDGGLIRENWVMVDLIHMHEQLGVDVFARMRQVSNTAGR